jgi:hypothetical protein
MSNEVKLPHWNNEECCGLCRADKGLRNFKDPRRSAGWRPTVHSQLSFRERFGPSANHEFLKRMVSVSLRFWALDILHIMDYHGVSCHILGNIINMIVRDNELGVRTFQAGFDRPREKLGFECTDIGNGRSQTCFAISERLVVAFKFKPNRLNEDLKQFYQRRHVDDRLQLSMKVIGAEKLDKYPVMQGPGIKGATVRIVHVQLCCPRQGVWGSNPPLSSLPPGCQGEGCKVARAKVA